MYYRIIEGDSDAHLSEDESLMSQTGEGEDPNKEPDDSRMTKMQSQLKGAIVLSEPKPTCRDLRFLI